MGYASGMISATRTSPLPLPKPEDTAAFCYSLVPVTGRLDLYMALFEDGSYAFWTPREIPGFAPPIRTERAGPGRHA